MSRQAWLTVGLQLMGAWFLFASVVRGAEQTSLAVMQMMYSNFQVVDHSLWLLFAGVLARFSIGVFLVWRGPQMAAWLARKGVPAASENAGEDQLPMDVYDAAVRCLGIFALIQSVAPLAKVIDASQTLASTGNNIMSGYSISISAIEAFAYFVAGTFLCLSGGKVSRFLASIRYKADRDDGYGTPSSRKTSPFSDEDD